MECLPLKIEINNHIKNIYLKLKNIDNNNLIIKYQKFNSKINKVIKNKYIPELITNFINNNKSIKTSINLTIDKSDYIINLYFFKIPNNIVEIYENIIKIITLLSTYKKTIYKNNNYEINIYFTNFKKEINFKDNIIGPLNVNTGVTSSYNSEVKIIIYRIEEWFKVLIHELIHAFNFDFKDNYIAFKELKKYYNINSEFNLNESYVEFWARLINVIYYCNLKSNNNEVLFEKNFKKYFKKEINHSIDSGLKILSLMSIHNNNYEEKSNVFAYYIITSLLIINYKNFINWCYHYNDNLINISSEKIITYKFVNKIIEYNKNDLSINSYLCGNIKDNSLTMTTINIFN